MKTSFLGFILLLMLASCTQEWEPCPYENNNIVQNSTQRLDSCRSAVNLYAKEDDQFLYCFLIGQGKLEMLCGPSYFNYRWEYLRLIFKSDVELKLDLLDLTGEYALEENGFSQFCYRDSLGSLHCENVAEGTLTLGERCPIYNSLHLDFVGKQLNGEEITASSYINSWSSSFDLDRKVQGSFTYRDSTYDFTSATKSYGPNKYLRLSDYYLCNKNELLFDILAHPEDLSGQYQINTTNEASKFKAYFIYTDLGKWESFQVEFESGELQISESDENYDIQFNLLSRDNHPLTGSWKGKLK